MAKVRPEYEVVEEFSKLANQIVEKYPEIFCGVDADKICCVKVTNKERGETNNKLWKLEAVKMPVRWHCAYAWYITLFSSEWDILDESHKLALIAEILCGVPKEINNEGKVNGFDSKGYKLMQRTFKTIDYMTDPVIPHILNEDIDWVQK